MGRTVPLTGASEAVIELVGLREEPSPGVVLIDGRSGSGKSVLAGLLVRAWRDGESRSVELIRLDDLYPGWGGLRSGSEHLLECVLKPRAEGREQRWQRWDWGHGAPGDWQAVDPRRTLIVEGCGSLSAANRALADVGVWIEADDSVRKRRALARDGEAYEPYWEMWAAQEDAFIHTEDPRSRADLIVRGDD